MAVVVLVVVWVKHRQGDVARPDWVISVGPEAGPLRTLLKAEVEKAERRNLTALLMLVSDKNEKCRSIEERIYRIQVAPTDAVLVRVDVDHFASEVAGFKIDTSDLPCWVAISDLGEPMSVVLTGSAVETVGPDEHKVASEIRKAAIQASRSSHQDRTARAATVDDSAPDNTGAVRKGALRFKPRFHVPPAPESGRALAYCIKAPDSPGLDAMIREGITLDSQHPFEVVSRRVMPDVERELSECGRQLLETEWVIRRAWQQPGSGRNRVTQLSVFVPPSPVTIQDGRTIYVCADEFESDPSPPTPLSPPPLPDRFAIQAVVVEYTKNGHVITVTRAITPIVELKIE